MSSDSISDNSSNTPAVPSPVDSSNIDPNPVQTILDDLTRLFPLEDGETRWPSPGERNDRPAKVVGFSVFYGDGPSDDAFDCDEPFMTTDFLRDTTGAAITVHRWEDAEALRRYSDEVIGMPYLVVPNPVGGGYMFLYMKPDAPITEAGRRLYGRLAVHLNQHAHSFIAGAVSATFHHN